MSLSDAELTRYARHIVLKEVGGAGQRRLKAASVAIVGCGGIGAPAIAYLAGAGVGRLILVDNDTVEASNLPRQILYNESDVGRAKVAATAARVKAANPAVATVLHATRIDADNAANLLAGADVVLDGSDNFATRFAVADAALAARIPLVSAAVGQFEGQLGVYRGWEADKPCYRCFVGDDPERAETSCAENGILGPVTGFIGTLAALEVLRTIAPFGEDAAGRLLLIDLLSMRFRGLTLPNDPACAACGMSRRVGDVAFAPATTSETSVPVNPPNCSFPLTPK